MPEHNHHFKEIFEKKSIVMRKGHVLIKKYLHIK